METNTNREHRKDRNEGEMSRLKKAMAIVTLGTIGAGVGTAAGIEINSAIDHYQAHERAVAAAEANTHERDALEHELRTAYEGPIAIDQAENTHKTTMKFGDKRGVINFHIDGSGKNKETANSTNTPSYMYGENPHAHLTAIDGSPTEVGAISVWKSGQERGDAVLSPRLATFSGSEPKTLDYEVDLEAEGYLSDPNDPNKLHELKAEYPAGNILVTGSHGKITSIDVQQRQQNEDPVEISEEITD